MKTSTLFTAILATALFATNATAQSTGASARGDAQASAQGSIHPDTTADMLAQRYAEAAGSAQAATEIVDKLRSGAEGQVMGYGDIDTALALAANMVVEGDAASFDGAIDAVSNLRNDGLGWGQVAQELGYNLGSVISTAHGMTAAVPSTLSAASNLSTNRQTGIEAAGSRVGIGTDVSAAGNARIERPAADLRTNGRINIGADVRPSLPPVRPLLGR